MKPIREHIVAAPGSKRKTLAHYRDFTLIAVAGFGVFYGETFAMEARAGASTFNLKVAVGCFAVAAACVVLTANRLLALFCAAMIPAVLMWGAFRTREIARFYLLQIAAALLVLFLGLVVKFARQRLRLRRGR